MRLFGCLFDLDRERLGAGPGMLGDIEEDALGTAAELLTQTVARYLAG